ncbi:MAG: hypothetical protein IKR34_02380 [Candidatus Gastranaerophilales bacterium]|nr:hypothetical protein [Candidatus Gastranaerophilales bacterium]
MGWSDFHTARFTVSEEYDDATGKTTAKNRHGDVISERFDNDKNGVDELKVDYIDDSLSAESIFDNNSGNILSKTMTSNGQMLSKHEYEYDESGRILAEIDDNDGDGKTDYITEYKYPQDPNSKPLIKKIDKNSPIEKIADFFRGLLPKKDNTDINNTSN